MRETGFAVAWAAALIGACGAPAERVIEEIDAGPTSDADVTPADGDASAGEVDAEADGDGDAASSEVCDGWDNDGDEAIDEGTGGGACAVAAGVQGEWVCVGGRLRCRQCTPGETREVPCGCGEVTHDVCGDDGAWNLGVCDGCPYSAGAPCGFCGVLGPGGACVDGGECAPGETMFIRCDLCQPEDQFCGTTCVGEQWRCAANCLWQKETDCQVVGAPQCDRDEEYFQPCGLCGVQRRFCDGCFWTRSRCMGEGVCQPGTSKTTPCFDNACEDGYTSQARCNDACAWETEACGGCTPGPTGDPVTSECVVGHAACGVMITRTTCAAGAVSICGATKTLVTGTPSVEVLRDDCSSLPCRPGDLTQRACTAADGRCGSEPLGCTAACTWDTGAAPGAYGACVANAWSCVPGEQQSFVYPCSACGDVYQTTETRTCVSSGCGWTSSFGGGCPACAPGQSDSQTCDMGGGTCGVQGRSCEASTCEWGAFGACGYTCTPGSSSSVEACWGCGGMCGRTMTVTTTCSGCGSSTSYDTSACGVECCPGAQRSTPCGNCNQVQTDTCSSACVWQLGACPPDTCG